jgi:hypothetical protein
LRLELPLRIYLTIRKRADGFGQHEPGTPDRFLPLKTAVMLFFSLSVLIGVLIAAFALGSLLAIISYPDCSPPPDWLTNYGGFPKTRTKKN